MNFDLSLYLVSDRTIIGDADFFDIISKAASSGVTMVQLREKDCSTREFLEIAQKTKEILSPYKIPLIINDRADIALAIDADGLHIGQSDMPYHTARKLLGEDKIIGLSVESIEDVRKANMLDVDYIGISPIFSTPTKTDTMPPFGIEGAKEAVSLSKHPTVAIGGINLGNIPQVFSTGVDGVALVSAIMAASDPSGATEELARAISLSK